MCATVEIVDWPDKVSLRCKDAENSPLGVRLHLVAHLGLK